MIIGGGDIASVLKDNNDVVYFASGLSNSTNVRYCDLIRERRAINTTLRSERHIVYFSSLCQYYTNSDYSLYKQEIEEFVKAKCKSYTIVRIGNIDWGANPNTLINYIKANPDCEIKDEYRYIVSKEEFLYWVDLIRPYHNDIMNIPGERIKVRELYKRIHGHYPPNK